LAPARESTTSPDFASIVCIDSTVAVPGEESVSTRS
jgi:hypothetical protein